MLKFENGLLLVTVWPVKVVILPQENKSNSLVRVRNVGINELFNYMRKIILPLGVALLFAFTTACQTKSKEEVV